MFVFCILFCCIIFYFQCQHYLVLTAYRISAGLARGSNDGEKQYIDFDRVNEEPQNWSYKNPLNSKTIVISNLLSQSRTGGTVQLGSKNNTHHVFVDIFTLYTNRLLLSLKPIVNFEELNLDRITLLELIQLPEIYTV